MSFFTCLRSTGDVQPYVALGKLLQKDGHRVRIASHETFRSFVNDSGLEFFNIGGDPHELMSYMVRSEEIIQCRLFRLIRGVRSWIDARHGISYKWRYWTETEDAR